MWDNIPVGGTVPSEGTTWKKQRNAAGMGRDLGKKSLAKKEGIEVPESKEDWNYKC